MTATQKEPEAEPKVESPWSKQENLVAILMVLEQLARQGILFHLSVDYTPANSKEEEIFRSAMREFWLLFPPSKGPRNPWR
jgi:hypothetical protein